MPGTRGRMIHLESVDSTNTYLKELAGKGEVSFYDCVVADTQTSGRGRLGRSFSSAKGKGIYLSYLINPKGASPEEISKITAWGAVAVRDAIFEVCGVSAGIKWVNDLVYESRKICGILTEMSFGGESGRIQSLIMGIGINVNHDRDDFPADLRDTATSLKLLTGIEADREKLMAVLVQKLDKLNDDFPQKKEYYLEEYRSSCVVPGKKIKIIKSGNERIGTAIGIDEDFGLEVVYDDGEKQIVRDGDVSVRGFYGYI